MSKNKKKLIGYIGQEKKSYIHDEKLIKIPNQAAFKALKRELSLAPAGLHALEVLIRNLKEDLDNIAAVQRAPDERRDLINHLKTIAKAVSVLDFQCRQRKAVINEIIPEEARAELGLALTFSTMGQILGKPLFPENFNAQMERMLNEGHLISVESIEAYYAPRRESLGIHHGGELFSALVGIVHKSLEKWISAHNEKNSNSGYRRTPRNRVLYWLIYEAEEILGVDRIGQPGEIFRLCAAVIRCLGLNDNGLRSSVTRMKPLVDKDKLAHAAGA